MLIGIFFTNIKWKWGLTIFRLLSSLHYIELPYIGVFRFQLSIFGKGLWSKVDF